MWCQASPCCPSVQFHVLCEICAATYPNDGVGVVVMNPGLAFEASHVTRLWRDTSSTNAAVALKQGSIAGGKMMTPTYGFVNVLLPRFLYVGNQLGEISPEPLRIDLQSFTLWACVFDVRWLASSNGSLSASFCMSISAGRGKTGGPNIGKVREGICIPPADHLSSLSFTIEAWVR